MVDASYIVEQIIYIVSLTIIACLYLYVAHNETPQTPRYLVAFRREGCLSLLVLYIISIDPQCVHGIYPTSATDFLEDVSSLIILHLSFIHVLTTTRSAFAASHLRRPKAVFDAIKMVMGVAIVIGALVSIIKLALLLQRSRQFISGISLLYFAVCVLSIIISVNYTIIKLVRILHAHVKEFSDSAMSPSSQTSSSDVALNEPSQPRKPKRGSIEFATKRLRHYQYLATPVLLIALVAEVYIGYDRLSNGEEPFTRPNPDSYSFSFTIFQWILVLANILIIYYVWRKPQLNKADHTSSQQSGDNTTDNLE